MKKYSELKRLKKSKNICLISHIEPDPDAISSIVVLKQFLMEYFKIKNVHLFAKTDELSQTTKIILGDNIINPNPISYDTAILLDCPNVDRAGEFKDLFINAKTKIVIDHHATNNFSGDVNIVENCSSTCEIIYCILQKFRYKLSKSQKGKLYSGIITDTNNFSVGEISARTFKVASKLAPQINITSIYKTFLANKTLKTMQLLALAINNIKSFNNNQIIITHITHEEAKKLHITHNDLLGIVNQISTINTAKLVCFIEPKNNFYYVSMRAKNGYNVSTIAKENGGGGHIGAAAFETKLDLMSIEDMILSSFRKQLKSIKEEPKNLF